MDRTAAEALVHRWITEGVALGKADAWDELLAPGMTDAPAIRARADGVRAALGAITVSVDDLVVDGDMLAWRWTLEGTHKGPFLGVAPTGARITVRGVNFQHVHDGRVATHWTLIDVAGALEQLKREGPNG